MKTGWRSYILQYGADGRPLLQGFRAPWINREMVAECWIPAGGLHSQCWRDEQGKVDPTAIQEYLNDTRRRAPTHLLDPDSDCLCGIYVAKTLYPLRDQGWGYATYAAVTFWGATRPYERGWRVEHARMEHLWVSPSFVCRPECVDYQVEIASPSRDYMTVSCSHLFTKDREERGVRVLPLDWLVDGLQQRYGVSVKIGTPPQSEEEQSEHRKANGEALRRARARRMPRVFSGSLAGGYRYYGVTWCSFTLEAHRNPIKGAFNLGVVFRRGLPLYEEIGGDTVSS